MSLKAFHFFFILVSILFAGYFASWSFTNYEETAQGMNLVFAVGSLIAAISLAGYLIWFLKKSKNFSFLALAATVCLSVPDPVWACATCFGNPSHPMTRAANDGVWFLMMVITAVLVLFASLFIFWGLRSRRHSLKVVI